MKRILLCVLFVIALLGSSVKAEEQTEDFEFQAEVGRLMDILINSLYTHKEIFLRELISNASDAIDKLRFQSVSNPEILGDLKDMEIKIEFDKENEMLHITDTGIGMTKNDLIQNLGTIAKSGTTNFMEAIKEGNLNIIGQFGVGFYSSFLVGQRVIVTSKNNDDDQYIWTSSAANSFSIKKDPEGNTLGRGTRVSIHLKQEAHEFLEEKTLKELIKKYSEFINFSIRLKTLKEVDVEVEIDGEYVTEKDGEGNEIQKPKTKKVKETQEEWKIMNDNKALWLRDKSEIEHDEYVSFYKALTKDYDEPMNWIHFKAEGDLEFTSLLYIPKRVAHDQFDNYYGASSSLKLYVRRVLINEEFEELMPRYLNFVKGVIDSDDLPINVSRESIQQLKMLKVMSRKLVRKTLEMIQKMADAHRVDDDDESEYSETEDESEQEKSNKEEKEESSEDEEEDDQEAKEKRKEEKIKKYNEFWREFGKSIKLGIIEDSSNREKLAKISRWTSSENLEELTSFQDYLDRAKPGQEHIYFIAGENKDQLMQHPTLQKLLKKGYEVLILDDPIDEFTFQNLNEFEKKKLQNVGKGDFKFPEDSDEERKRYKKLKKMFKPLTDWWKKLISVDLEEVRLSQRLVDDPCVLVSTESGHSANMERISKAQAYANNDRSNPYANAKKILEINPSHPAIKELFERVKEEPDRETEELARIMYEGAAITSGYTLSSPHEFSGRFYRLFNSALGIAKDAEIQDIEIDLEEDSDEEPVGGDNPDMDEEIDLAEMDMDQPDMHMDPEHPRDDL